MEFESCDHHVIQIYTYIDIRTHISHTHDEVRQGDAGSKRRKTRFEQCHIYTPTPHDKCNHYALPSWTNKE